MRISCRECGASARAFGRLCLAALVPLALIMWLITTGAAMAQGAPKKEPTKEKPSAAQQKAAPKPTLPDAYKLNLLIRSTIIAVNQANQTGNYTVLRELASPRFQKGNSKAQLAKIFAGLRKRNLDLAPIMLFDPKLVTAPTIDASGMLRLTGFIPTKPEQVLFDLAFESVEGKWRLFGIAINVLPPDTSAQQPRAKAKEAVAKDKSAGKRKANPAKKPKASAPAGAK